MRLPGIVPNQDADVLAHHDDHVACNSWSNRAVAKWRQKSHFQSPRSVSRSRVRSFGIRNTAVVDAQDEQDLAAEDNNLGFYEKDTLRAMSTMRAFFWFKGTILSNTGVLMEQVILFMVFLASVSLSSFADAEELLAGKTQLQEITSTLRMPISFLLGMYLGLCIARWTKLRSAGVGTIFGAGIDIVMYLTACSTDSKVLSAVSRYSRASLAIIFQERRGNPRPLRALVTRGFLYDEEVEQLEDNEFHAAALWVWILHLVAKVHRQGGMPDIFIRDISHAVLQGRQAVETIYAHHNTPIPFQYVHMLSLTVKVHNLVIAVTSGLLVGSMLSASPSPIEIVSVMSQMTLIPFTFSAILVMCQELQFPFDGYASGFPCFYYDEILHGGVRCCLHAADHLPDVCDEDEAAQ